MKKTIVLFVAVCLILPLLAGCGARAADYEKFSTSFFGTFDTIVFVIGYAREEAVFARVAAEAQAQFERLHQVYDGYTAYDGVKNLYYLNKEGAKGPVEVEPELMELLLYCKEMQTQTLGTVNVALGAVLRLWHDAREAAEIDPAHAALPDMAKLQAAAEHIDFDDVILDEAAGTVFFSDPRLKLDLGSVAKGYTCERVARWMLSSEMPSFILSAGGNVRAGDPPLDGRLRWGVSVQDPDGFALGNASTDTIETLFLTNLSVVTSGDYQRYFVVDGKRYHHIIDPKTLMPGEGLRAVTVVCEDSGWADLLSTTVFLLPYEEGRAFVDGLDGVEALWIMPDRSVIMTDGMAKMAKSQGATSSQ